MVAPVNRMSVIYVWLCPDTGVPIYVGKTSQPLAIRMASHRRLAIKGDLSPKYVWLRKCLSKGKEPLVIALERVDVERSAIIERRWVRRLSVRFDLANLAMAGAGNPGVGRVVWTPEIDALLGTVADSVLAKRLGCERKTVSYRRECLGIKASHDRSNNTPPPNMAGWNKLTLDDDIISILGTMPDHAVAKIAGVGKKKITSERNRRGIQSYASATGNDGRIKVGEPHCRWTPNRRFAPSQAPKVASSAVPLT
jgi:hypothetical protein